MRAIADRRTGIGFDQLIALRRPEDDAADAAFTIHNADGGEAEACGNAARCVAWMAMEDSGRDTARLETAAGTLRAWRAGPLAVTVDMGEPRFDWREIPLAAEQDTLHLPLSRGPLTDAVGVSMGNPHAVFFVDDADSVDLAALGPELEHDELFPERANIGIAQVRGAGPPAPAGCGSAASGITQGLRHRAPARRWSPRHRRGSCRAARPTVVAGRRSELEIEWLEDGHRVTDDRARWHTAFAGTLDEALLNGSET